MAEYTLIDHTGDIGIEWEAEDLPALFRAGAEALAGILVELPGDPAPGLSRTVELDALDLPDLMVRFFQEILFRFETHGELFPAARVNEASPDRGDARASLRAVLLGRSFDPANEDVRFIVKAVTYHGLEATGTAAGRWRARVIFDV